MSQAVIDVLEAVQVQEQHGTLSAVLLLVVEGRQQAAFEQCAIGQAGKRIVVSLVVELGLGVFEAGDIGEDGDEMGDLLITIAHRADGQPTGVQLAVLAAIGDFPCQCPSAVNWCHIAA